MRERAHIDLADDKTLVPYCMCVRHRHATAVYWDGARCSGLTTQDDTRHVTNVYRVYVEAHTSAIGSVVYMEPSTLTISRYTRDNRFIPTTPHGACWFNTSMSTDGSDCKDYNAVTHCSCHTTVPELGSCRSNPGSLRSLGYYVVGLNYIPLLE